VTRVLWTLSMDLPFKDIQLLVALDVCVSHSLSPGRTEDPCQVSQRADGGQVRWVRAGQPCLMWLGPASAGTGKALSLSTAAGLCSLGICCEGC
jgi:hypothetical protein